MKLKILCDYCGNDAVLTTGATIYPHRPDLHHLKFWHCSPCSAWVGCHRSGTFHLPNEPFGRLANAELRAAKQAAHAIFDPIWKNNRRKTRTQAYAWLAREMGMPPNRCHIGMFDLQECRRVVEICLRRNAQSATDKLRANRTGVSR